MFQIKSQTNFHTFFCPSSNDARPDPQNHVPHHQPHSLNYNTAQYIMAHYITHYYKTVSVHKYINYAIILCKASLLHNFNDGLQFTGKMSVFGTVNDNSK